MLNKHNILLFCLALTASVFLLTACSGSFPDKADYSGVSADIYPCYSDSLALPINIAPLNFSFPENVSKSYVKISCNNRVIYSESHSRKVSFGLKKWRAVLGQANPFIKIELAAKFSDGKIVRYKPFVWRVIKDKIDPFLVYRLIAPGDGVYGTLGLYQRDLSNFKVSTLIENTVSDQNCMNCHTFCKGDAQNMIFHLRYPSEGSIMTSNIEGQGEGFKKIALPKNAKDKNIRLIYPAYHPSGKFIAFSTNLLMGVSGYDAHRRFFNSIDSSSHIVIYDIAANKLFTNSALWDLSKDMTYPAWSPDGRSLFFCSAGKEDSAFLASNPSSLDRIMQIKFDLNYIGFDPSSSRIGDSVFTLCSASNYNKSFALPRVSPDGACVLVNTCSFSSFPARSDGDLGLVFLGVRVGADASSEIYANAGEYKNVDVLNSNEAESFHSWSSSGKWVVFSSKKRDGYYSLPYIAYFDGTSFSKPFLLPQKDGDFYRGLLKGFSLPEFTINSSSLNSKVATKTRKGKVTYLDISEIPE